MGTNEEDYYYLFFFAKENLFVNIAFPILPSSLIIKVPDVVELGSSLP